MISAAIASALKTRSGASSTQPPCASLWTSRTPRGSRGRASEAMTVLGSLNRCSSRLAARRRRAGGKGTLLPVNGHMAHAAAGLGTRSARDHLVVAKERAVEKHDVGALDPLHHRGGHCGGARNIDETRVPGRNLDADICRRLDRGLRILAFEIERQLAR